MNLSFFNKIELLNEEIVKNYNISYYTIPIFILFVFLFLFIVVLGFILSRRIYYASLFGKSEHFFGRVIGFLIIVDFVFIYYNIKILALLFIILLFISWLIYIISHTIEKMLYPSNFRFS